MLESLRGLGYSTAAALADVIDNSISAEASNIAVNLTWSGPASRISILDDGQGMSDPELESAMRLGDKNPLDARDPKDLGRFGMGLKTSSFSQCRRLTVASLKDGSASCLRWDLDALKDNPSGGWLMYEGPADGSEVFIEPLAAQKSGTLVLWECLDRIVTASYGPDDFNDLIDGIEAHLAMVFHRLIEGPKPVFRLTLNGKTVKPWDPFMDDHPSKTWSAPVEKNRTPSGVVEVEGHVLPHKDMLTVKEFEEAAGPAGWTAQQGFYIYRNKRLLVAGGWLGLGPGRPWNREEFYRLARIRLDIPNTADADWKIDIRKSTARPPVALRPWLTKLAEDTRSRARKVFAFRGAPVAGPGKTAIEQAWRVEHTAGGTKYRIDVKHSVVAAVLEAGADKGAMVKAMLRVIEETVPVQRIWLDTAEHHDTPRTGFSGEPTAAVIEVLTTLYEDMLERKHMSAEEAKKSLMSTEPFHNYPTLIAALGQA
ncbi:MAG: ATP-binding protein [Pseudomonadota bacterium]